MFSLLSLAAAVTPAPGDDASLRPGLDPAQVTPGLLGFLATLFLVVAVIFLIRDMTKRIRRVRYRTMVDEEGRPVPEDSGDDSPEYRNGEQQRHRPGGTHGPDAP